MEVTTLYQVLSFYVDLCLPIPILKLHPGLLFAVQEGRTIVDLAVNVKLQKGTELTVQRQSLRSV